MIGHSSRASRWTVMRTYAYIPRSTSSFKSTPAAPDGRRHEAMKMPSVKTHSHAGHIIVGPSSAKHEFYKYSLRDR